MELIKRGKTWHVTEGINKAGLKIPRHTTKCKDKEAAKDYLRAIERAASLDELPKYGKNKIKKPVVAAVAADAPTGLSLPEAMEKYLEWLKANKRRDTTLEQYRSVITTKMIAPFALKGVTHLNQARPAHARELQDGWIASGLSLNSILDYRAPMNGLFAWFARYQEEENIKNPWVPVIRPKEIRLSTEQCLQRGQIDDGIRTLPLDIDGGDDNWQAVRSNLVAFLLGRKEFYRTNMLAMEPERFLAFIELLYETGLRRGDATYFRPHWIERVDGIHICHLTQTKTGKPVSVTISEPLAARLKALRPLAWLGAPGYEGAGTYVFWDGSGGNIKRYMDNRIGTPLRDLGKALGIPGNLHPHRFRDSFAVNALASGRHLEEVSRLLGHKNIRTTQRFYAPDVLKLVKRRLALLAAARRPFLIAS